MLKSEAAKSMFLNGYNCAQSIFYAFREEFGLPEETVLKISCGLGAGMARQGKRDIQIVFLNNYLPCSTLYRFLNYKVRNIIANKKEIELTFKEDIRRNSKKVV